MTDDQRRDPGLDVLLVWHADLLSSGHPDRAAALAARMAPEEPGASLTRTATRLREALSPVAPGGAFRHSLRSELLSTVSNRRTTDGPRLRRLRHAASTDPGSVAVVVATVLATAWALCGLRRRVARHTRLGRRPAAVPPSWG